MDSLGCYTPGLHYSHLYNGSSVVDYVIAGEALLWNITYFKVHNLIGTLSDHCMISFMLRACYSNSNFTNHKRIYEFYKPHSLKETSMWF